MIRPRAVFVTVALSVAVIAASTILRASQVQSIEEQQLEGQKVEVEGPELRRYTIKTGNYDQTYVFEWRDGHGRTCIMLRTVGESLALDCDYPIP